MNLTALTDGVRRCTRRAFPRSWYMQLAEAFSMAACAPRMGFREYARLRGLCPDRCPPDGRLSQLRVPPLRYPIQLRNGTSDAIEVIHTVARETYRPWSPPPAQPRLIIDAGANIGDSTAYFLSRYPNARVVALEPDAENFRMLRLNCEPYGDRAVLLNAALWDRTTKVTVRAGANYSDRAVVGSDDGDVTAYAPADLIARYADGGWVDFFKIDIEGAEELLFAADCSPWLQRTRHLAIDVHGHAAGRVVQAAVSRHPFRLHRHRETFIYTRQD